MGLDLLRRATKRKQRQKQQLQKSSVDKFLDDARQRAPVKRKPLMRVEALDEPVPVDVPLLEYVLNVQQRYATEVAMILQFNGASARFSEVEIEHIKHSFDIGFSAFRCAQAIGIVRDDMARPPFFRMTLDY